MKRIFAFALCAFLLVCTFTIVGFAEEPMLPEVEETAEVSEPTITESVVGYVKTHLEEISVIITLLLTIFYNARKHSVLNKTISTLNNNAINVATNSEASVKGAIAEVDRFAAAVVGFSDKIEGILSEFRANAEDKAKLAAIIEKFEGVLVTAKLANIELADEVAELLVLANIPNAKKEELYARHIAAVNAISEAEKTEVIHHDGEEA